jgi:hypothetical protein
LVYVIVAAVALRTAGGWHYNIPTAIAILCAALLASVVFLFPAWRRWNRLARAYRRERNQVRWLRKHEPLEPCAWGDRCPAAVEGPGARCPKFGPSLRPDQGPPSTTPQTAQ